MMNEKFALDVLEGLTSQPKYLFSKYLYDEKGNEILKDILELDEYYVTDCEMETLSCYKNELLEIFSKRFAEDFHLIELGAGDGSKTRILLNEFTKNNQKFFYSPVDLSESAINTLKNNLRSEYPGLNVIFYNTDYLEAFNIVYKENLYNNKVFIFLGSSFGNLTTVEANGFLNKLSIKINENDLLLIGFDLMKNPYTILNAYNDKSNVTSEFNLNLLTRINFELVANFDRIKFFHYPTYDPVTGETKSYLISKENQIVEIKKLKTQIEFKKYEAIFTEISKKFSLQEIENYAKDNNFNIVKNFFDRKGFYCLSLWRKNNICP